MILTQNHVNQIAYDVVGCAIEVHNELGPGLLESIYEQCMIEELRTNGFNVSSQVPVPINYKGKQLKQDLRLDLLIDDLIVVELKAVEAMLPVFKAQLLTYLKLAKKPKGLLINFHCKNIVEQMVPLVTRQFSELDEN
ncbi:MAG: GxxExxY protein [Bacteroidota bacterium]